MRDEQLMHDAVAKIRRKDLARLRPSVMKHTERTGW